MKHSERRYSDICGATNNRGEPCKLPAGWGTPGSQKGRCRYHGGSSTGPKNTKHLEENDHAEGNSGGSAPKGNANAEIHGGFSDWKKAYKRLDKDAKAYVDHLREEMRETAKEHAPDVDPERRERLIKEKATLSILNRRTMMDSFPGPDTRGFAIEEEKEYKGETYTQQKLNPAFNAGHRISERKREIAKELKLWPGFW